MDYKRHHNCPQLILFLANFVSLPLLIFQQPLSNPLDASLNQPVPPLLPPLHLSPPTHPPVHQSTPPRPSPSFLLFPAVKDCVHKIQCSVPVERFVRWRFHASQRLVGCTFDDLRTLNSPERSNPPGCHWELRGELFAFEFSSFRLFPKKVRRDHLIA